MKKIKFVHGSLMLKALNKITGQNIGAITLYPFIFTTYQKGAMPKWMINHELIHISQIRDLGFFSFYISYLLYFLANLLRFKDGNMAYYKIPYEEAAYKLYSEGSEYEG